MFKPEPRPDPKDVGCDVWKQCSSRCGTCTACRQFNHKLKDLLPHDTQSKYQRHTFEWNDK